MDYQNDVQREEQARAQQLADGSAAPETETQEAGKPAKKKRLPLILGVIAVLILLALIAFRILGQKEKIETNPLSTVSVGHAEYGDISIESSLIGRVMPGDVYHVTPKTAGEILEILVSTGDRVSAGDPICRIDNSKQVDSARISLDAARVQLGTAEDAVALARTNLDRMSALLSTGDISRQNFESAQNGYDQAAAGLEAARLQLDGAQLQYDTQLEFSTVTAPVSGVVESTSMSLNGMASTMSEVCVISSEGERKLSFNITDRLLDAFRSGTPVTVSRQGSEYPARITTVSTLPDASGLYPVEAVFEEAIPVSNGASVKVAFTAEKAERVLLLDTDDVHYDGGKTYVYTLSYTSAEEAGEQSTIAEANKAGSVHKVEVHTGLSNSEKTQILDGIDEDTLVILSWTSQLYEGALVQVLPEG